MAQAQIRTCELGSEVDISVTKKKRKITFNIDTSHYISVFKNETGDTVINIRKGTRSVSITKDLWIDMCDLKVVVCFGD